MVKATTTAVFLSIAALLGCASEEVPYTQLMLVADTDIAQLDQIYFDVSQDGRTRESGKIDVDSADAPFTMAVLREEGSLGPLTARAIGYQGSRALVERSAVVSFSPGKTLTVVLHLVRSCMNQQCDDGETCTERGCEPSDAGVLSPWNGNPPTLEGTFDAGQPRPDAGSPDAGQPRPDAGVPPDDAATQGPDAGDKDASNAVWTDCSTGEVDINSDPNHCGRCGRVCRTAPGTGSNLAAACIDGECGVACRHLWGDCDGDASNGCENWLSYDQENCGACGLTCPPEEYCWLGACLVR